MDKISKNIEEQVQKYSKLVNIYADHYSDSYTQIYRDKYYRESLFGFELKGLKVLDAMCGPGVETEYLLKRGAQVTGLDVSYENVQAYKRRLKRDCVKKSIHETGFESGTFDVVYISGGLHHIVPMLSDVMQEVHRILKNGGRFCFLEPNAEDITNTIRKIWYKYDKRFGRSEAAINYSKLKGFLKLGFREDYHKKLGNIAYLFIAQSMVTKTPKSLKEKMYRPLFLLEDFFNSMPLFPKMFFVSRWIKEK